MTRTCIVLLSLVCCLCAIQIISCGSKTEKVASVIHLTQVYKPEFVQDRVKPAVRTDLSANLWKFNGEQKFVYETFGVIQPTLAETGLSGKAKDDFPLVRLERKVDPNDNDRLHSIEIRMKASVGKIIQVFFDSAEKVDVNQLRERSRNTPFRIETPLLPGEMQTYKLTSPRSDLASEIRQIFVRVTDAAEADFEMESVRLIFRKEYLAGIPSGPGWHGLSEIYHDTLVSRAPEKIRMPVRLPSAAWLDLSLGTLDNSPVQFVVSISNGKDKQPETLLKRTVTRSQAWERAPIDLSRYQNQDVTLTLATHAEEAGQIAFWGSPVIRSSAATRAAARKSKSDGKRPQGFILIWADTLRSDHMDLYGYHRETAPHLKRMAAEGAVFEEHMVQGTWTKVSTPSLLTGLYPSSHGVVDFLDRVPASAETLAEIFQKQGYATVQYSSVLFTGQFTNLHQGFDELHEDTSLPDQRSSKTARVYVDRLIPWLEVHKDVPFFVFLHITDPHDPFKPYPPYDSMWADPSKEEEHERNAMKVREAIQDPLLKRFGMPTRAELIKASIDSDEYLKYEMDWYDGSIRGMDAEISRLLERLEELKLDRDTLIVFVGDHGEEFHEHGRMFHGQSVYRELARTPLIFRQPGVIPAGTVIKETVENIDVMPTILEFFGFSASQPLQGKSLLPLILQGKNRSNIAHSDEPTGNTAIVEKAATSQSGGPPPREKESVAIILDGWKLIHNTKKAADAPEYELYEVNYDPREQKNLAAEKPDIVRRLATEISRWRKITASQKLKSDAETTKGMSQEELERLRSLGYIQ